MILTFKHHKIASILARSCADDTVYINFDCGVRMTAWLYIRIMKAAVSCTCTVETYTHMLMSSAIEL